MSSKIEDRSEIHLELRHDAVLTCSHKIPFELYEAIQEDLNENTKFNCQLVSEKDSEEVQILIGLNDENMLLQAAENENQLCEWQPVNPEKREARNRMRQEQKAYLDPRIIEIEKRKPFKLYRRETYSNGDFDQMLTEADKSRLFFVVLEQIDFNMMPRLFARSDKGDAAYKHHQKETLLDYLKRIQAIEEITPLWSKSKHIRAMKENRAVTERSDLLKQLREKTRLFIDIKLIRDYYGDEIAIYHEWMKSFQRYLIWPGLLSIVVFILNNTVYTSENSPASALFSLMMTFWGIFFLINWKRHQKSLNYLWDDYANEDNRVTHNRKEFYGSHIISQVTDQPDLQFTFKQRLPLYVQSFAVCFPCLMGALFVIVCFLNASGVIRPDHHGGAFNMPMLSQLADEGAIFDPESNMNLVAAIAQTIVTTIMNLQFRKVAKWTTDLENHKTQEDYDYSLFVKRFIFEFTDFQMYLFYIGLYQRHIGLLRTNLVSLFMVDEIRRVVCEVIIPSLTQNKDEIVKQASLKLKKSLSMDKNAEDSSAKVSAETKSLQEEINREELAELQKDESEIFDDYLEMIMTYGYITLFSAAFPFGAFCTFVFLHVEIRSDLFKMEKLCRRPHSHKTHTIGTWFFALQALTYASIFTNMTLCCFASNQIDALFPWMSKYKDFSKEAIMMVVMIEHIILAVVLVFKNRFDTEPNWLATFKNRRTHKLLKKMKITHD